VSFVNTPMALVALSCSLSAVKSNVGLFGVGPGTAAFGAVEAEGTAGFAGGVLVAGGCAACGAGLPVWGTSFPVAGGFDAGAGVFGGEVCGGADTGGGDAGAGCGVSGSLRAHPAARNITRNITMKTTGTTRIS